MARRRTVRVSWGLFVLSARLLLGCGAPPVVTDGVQVGDRAADFFRAPVLRSAAISLDGEWIAGVRSSGAEDQILLLPFADPDSQRVVLTETRRGREEKASRRIRFVGWGGNDRIVYSIGTPLRSREDSWSRHDERGWSTSDQNTPGVGLRARKSRLYSTDFEGRRRWIGKRWRDAEYSQYQDHILSWLPKEPGFLLVQYWGRAIRVRIGTGTVKLVQPRRQGISSWSADHMGEVRVGGRYRDWSREKSLFVHKAESKAWVEVSSFDRYRDHGFWHAGFSEVPDRIYVFSDRTDAGDLDKTGLFEFDLRTEEQGSAVLVDQEFDVSDAELLSSPEDGRLLAIRHLRDSWTTTLVDPEWRETWKPLQRRFPGLDIEVESLDARGRRMLVRTTSDRSPPRLYAYDAATGEARLIAEAHPSLRDREHVPIEPYQFEARDGRRIPGYLARPEGSSGPGPTVVLVHDGPARRNDGAWEPLVQYLAMRGLVVYLPDYRGSTGYGRTFERLGDGQWNDRVQSDIVDGLESLVSADVADPRRVGIYGRGFGGYLALLALIENPDRFAAGAGLGALTDLSKLFSDDRRYFRAASIDEAIFGQLYEDRALRDAASPVEQAHRINVPVLLGHGSQNPVYHVVHMERMTKALRRAGGRVEAHLYPGATSRFLDDRQAVDFFRRLGDFFMTHLAEDRSTQGDS